MALIDFILNVAAVLLWLNWRSAKLDSLLKRAPTTLVGTLKRTEPSRFRSRQVFATVAALLLLRALVYWQIGPSSNWTPRLDLFFVSLAFRGDVFTAVLLFSFLSFLRVLTTFYFWMLALAFINRAAEDAEPLHRLVELQLGPIARLPRPIQILLPLVVATLLWAALSPLLVATGVMERSSHWAMLIQQGLLLSLALYFSLRYLLPVFLLIHLVVTYVYLGRSPVWEYISATSRRLTAPFKNFPLRFGRVDATPLLAAVALLLILDALPRYLLSKAATQAPIWPQ